MICPQNHPKIHHTKDKSFQLICQASPGCKYFYRSLDFCKIYSEEPIGECDGIAGPVSPSISTCQSNIPCKPS